MLSFITNFIERQLKRKASNKILSLFRVKLAFVHEILNNSVLIAKESRIKKNTKHELYVSFRHE